MATVIFGLVVGCGFILLGRWIYRNPQKMFVRAFYKDPDNPPLMWFVRAWALIIITVGSFAVIGLATEYLFAGLGPAGGTLVTLALSVLAAWFLLPRLPRDPRPRAKPERAGGILTPEGKRFVWIILALATVITIVTVTCAMLHVDLALIVPFEAIAMGVVILVFVHPRGSRS